jgi:hypothetical protein
VTDPTQQEVRAAGIERGADDDRGYGWIIFAALLLLMLGTMNFIEGIAAIGNAHFFVHNTHYVVASLKFWGWVVFFFGLVQFAIGLGVFFGIQAARWAGVAVLACNVIAQLLMIPAYPFWSLAIFALDVVAIYGLSVYGRLIGQD